MSNKSKKIVATVVAVATLAVNTIGMNASAAEARNVTATKNFSVGSYTARATIYRDSSQASASTKLTDATSVTVSLSVTGGKVSTSKTYGDESSGYVSVVKRGSGFTYASSGHIAIKGGKTGSTNMAY